MIERKHTLPDLPDHLKGKVEPEIYHDSWLHL